MAKQQSKIHMLHPSMRWLNQGLTKHKKHVYVPFAKDVCMRRLQGTPSHGSFRTPSTDAHFLVTSNSLIMGNCEMPDAITI